MVPYLINQSINQLPGRVLEELSLLKIIKSQLTEHSFVSQNHRDDNEKIQNIKVHTKIDFLFLKNVHSL